MSTTIVTFTSWLGICGIVLFVLSWMIAVRRDVRRIADSLGHPADQKPTADI